MLSIQNFELGQELSHDGSVSRKLGYRISNEAEAAQLVPCSQHVNLSDIWCLE